MIIYLVLQEVDRRLIIFENEVLVYVFIEVVVVGLGYFGVEFFVILVERFGQKGIVKVIDMVLDIVVLVLVGIREVVLRVNFYEIFSCIWSFVVFLCNL